MVIDPSTGDALAELAAREGAVVVESPTEPVNLIVVGSQPDAPPGRIVIGGDVHNELKNARSSLLVLPAERRAAAVASRLDGLGPKG